MTKCTALLGWLVAVGCSATPHADVVDIHDVPVMKKVAVAVNIDDQELKADLERQLRVVFESMAQVDAIRMDDVDIDGGRLRPVDMASRLKEAGCDGLLVVLPFDHRVEDANYLPTGGELRSTLEHCVAWARLPGPCRGFFEQTDILVVLADARQTAADVVILTAWNREPVPKNGSRRMCSFFTDIASALCDRRVLARRQGA